MAVFLASMQPITVSAATAGVILDPRDLGATVHPSEDGYLMKMVLDDTSYWSRTTDNANGISFVGSEWKNQSVKESDIDNLDYFIYPMGNNVGISTNGLRDSPAWEINFTFTFSTNIQLTQGFDILLQPYILMLDASGNTFNFFNATKVKTHYTPDMPIHVSFSSVDFNVADDPFGFYEAPYITFRCLVQFDGIEDESISLKSNFNTASKFEITIPVSDAYANNFQHGEILDSINPDSGGASQDFQDNVNDQSSTLESMGAILGSLDKPDPGNVNVSIDSYVDPVTLTQTVNVFDAIWDSPYFLTMLLLLLSMAVVSYALFGKR